LKVYQLPLASRNARGRPIVNILPLEENERITAILPIQEFEEGKYVLMATANGTVKKTALTSYSRPRSNGIIAVNLNDGDELIGVDITDGESDIMLFSDAGKVVRFNEKARDSETGLVKIDPETGEEILALRPMGRTATGVRGIRLKDGQKVVSLIVPQGDGAILTATENGYGKRTPVEDYPAKSRATQGVVSIKVSDRNGNVVGAVQVVDGQEIMLISDQGTLVRTRVDEVSTVGRNTQGVRLIRTAEAEHVVALQRIDEIETDEILEDGDNEDVVEANLETSESDGNDTSDQSGDNPTSE
jgi:DNA gyrase subunit A